MSAVFHYPGESGDAAYAHHQASASTVWPVVHNLGKIPSVTVLDSSGREIEGSRSGDTPSGFTLTFSAPFAGLAYCN